MKIFRRPDDKRTRQTPWPPYGRKLALPAKPTGPPPEGPLPKPPPTPIIPKSDSGSKS